MRAFREADFDFCAEALTDNPAPEAIALRARALTRLGHYEDCLAAISRTDLSALPNELAAELLVLESSAFHALGDARAESALLYARVRAYSCGCAAIEGEYELAAARRAWGLGHIDEALAGVERVLAVDQRPPEWMGTPRPGYPFSAGYWRARALDLRGIVLAVRGDFAGQSASITAAFEEFDQANVVDVLFEASTLFNLAVLARDLEDVALGSFVRDRVGRVQWNAHTYFFEFEVFRSLAWCEARNGNHLGAFRYFRRAAEVAPTNAFRVIATLDRSFLARELGEVVTSNEDLEYSLDLTKKIDWERASLSERSALYLLASQVAPSNPTEARRLLDRYTALRTPGSHLHLSKGDRRQRAEECSAIGAVLRAEGHRERAISLLLESFQLWSEVGYAWRAGGVAIDLADLTGERRYFEVAAGEAAKQPNSWLARRLVSLEASATTS